MNFTFTGELAFNGLETEHPFLREGTTKGKNGKSGKSYKSLNLIVIAAKNNRGYAEIFGMKNESISTKSSTGEAIEIDWADRLDEDVIKTVDSMRKFTISDGDERHEFITEFDLITYIAEHVDDLSGRRAIVSGSVGKNEYNGKVTNRFTFRRITLLDDEDDRKNSLRVKGIMFFNKEGIDIADWASEKKINISAYTHEYVGKDDNGDAKYAYYEQPILFDASKVDFENEKHVKMLKFRLRQLGLEFVDENKVKIAIKKGWISQNLILAYANGAEAVELTYDELTETQKEMVDLGMKEVKDFAPKGGSFGERKVIYKAVDFDLVGDYQDGFITCDTDTCEEIEENIYVPVPVTESADELEEEVEEKPKKSNKPVEEDDEDIFS